MSAPVVSDRPVDHRSLAELAWPILVSMLSFTLLSSVNAIYVGWLGTTELAAVGLASTTVYAAQALSLGLLGGVRVIVAQRTGAGRPDEAHAATWLGLYVALVAGVLVALAVPLGPVALRSLGASDAVLPHAVAYQAWRTAPSGVAFVFSALVASFQGRGDTRTPMLANVIANVVNVVLDPMLMFGVGPLPEMGVAGAALGCSIGIAAGLGFLAWHTPRTGLGPPRWPSRASVAELVRIGGPGAIQGQFDVISYVLLAGLLASCGDAHMAAHVIIVRVILMSFTPCHAIGEATSVLVGHAVGAADAARARLAHRLGAIQGVALMAALGVVFLLGGSSVVRVFGAAPDVVALATPVITLYALVQVIDGLGIVSLGALTGAGDTRFAMVATLLGAWLIKLPLAALLGPGLGYGVFGVWLGIAGEIVVISALAAWRVRGTQWLAAVPRPPAAELVGAAVGVVPAK